MKCTLCGKNEATIHLTEVVNEKITKLHICEACAKHKSSEMQSHFGLTDLLSGLMDFGSSVTEDRIAQAVNVKCPVCDSSYYDFQKTGRFGCGACYETFSKNLSELLRKIHGSEKHVGKMPFKGPERTSEQKDLARLKNELDELIRGEEFEKAALLRDRIRELEDKLR